MVWVPRQFATAIEPNPFLETARDSRVSGVCAATDTTRRPKKAIGMPESSTHLSTTLEMQKEKTATQKKDMAKVNAYQPSLGVPYSHSGQVASNKSSRG